MKVLAYASLAHYADHIRPILQALPEGLRGGLYGPRDVQSWGPEIPRVGRGERVVWLVGSLVDAQKVSGPFVYVEHGAGQSYGGDEMSATLDSYAGGTGPEWKRCVLVIAPGNIAGARHLAVRDCPVALVGCPYLDSRLRGEWPCVEDRPTVAITFHWDAVSVCPEARWVLPHYEGGLEAAVSDLRRRGWDVWGHGHPKAAGALKRLWREMGVPWVTRDRIMCAADVLVADNTSLSWEFASLGGKLVFLNAPWYRRDVEHGLRFWRWSRAGVAVSEAGAIPNAVALAHADPLEVAVSRRSAVREVYAHVDGSASDRAASAIVETINA